MRKLAFAMLALLVACSGQQKKEEGEKAEEMPKLKMEAPVEYARTEAGNPIVMIKTSMGDFEVEVFETDCPIHAANFMKLVEADIYDDNIFHRVVANFMIQTGDPTGTGGGGPGYILDPEPVKYKNVRGNIAMAQSPQGINGSQFYVLVADSPHLDNQFPCFARVINGMDVVDAISKIKTEKERPVEVVKIIEAMPKPKAETETMTEESHEEEGH
jgi:peptidylprolyl isomerase